MCIMHEHCIDMNKSNYNVFSRLSSVCHCLISDIQLLVEIKIIQAYYIIMSS